MSVPVKYLFILQDNTVLSLKTVSTEVRARIDSIGIRSAELTFRNKEVLIFAFDADRIVQMRLRGARSECMIPDNMVQQIAGLQFTRTVLSWPGRYKRAGDADRFCLEINGSGNFSSAPKHPPVTICFRDGCDRIGTIDLIGDDR